MKKYNESVEKHRKLILDSERYIWEHPETGYKETETSAYMEKVFKELGYDITVADGITGFYTIADTGKPGPEILVLAELDSIICPDHPDADPETGAVHSCGHNAQCAALIGLAAALKEPGVMDSMCGKIKLCAVPAEELLEIEYRSELKKNGVIKYMGGKSEFLSRGYFDDSQIAFMIHTADSFKTKKGSIGCIAKKITYKGLAAHAGDSPWNGRNALYAATCGINAINAIRETFKDSDIIRVHPIITQGGAMVNAIPEMVKLESYVRGKIYEGIIEANKRINRALCGAALSLGTNVDICDIPGYAPLNNDNNMIEVVKDAAGIFIPEYNFTVYDEFSSGCTDMGDLSCVMPVVHPYAGGSCGEAHGNNYSINDPEAACVASAKLQLGMLYLLLSDDAKRARHVIEEYKPLFSSKEEFLKYQDALNREGDRIIYGEDGNATVIL